MAWFVLEAIVIASTLCVFVHCQIEQHGAVSSGLVARSCSMETLKQDGFVDRCFGSDDTPVGHVENDLVPVVTICTIKCRKHVGISYRLCDTDGYWTGPPLKCVAKEGISEKETIRVKRGWRRVRRSFRRATRRIGRTWRRFRNRVGCWLFRCRRPGPPPDRTSPTLYCPSDIHKTADAFQDSTRVYWSEPAAYDDRDGKITAYRKYWHRPGLYYSEGTTTVGYYSRDKAGNYGSCSFNIYISVTRCRAPVRISHGYFVCRPSHDYRYGGWCRYGCYRGYRISAGYGASLMECRGSGDWSRGTPSCEKVRCPLLYPQPHTTIHCSDWNNFQSKCSYICADGYRVPSGQNGVRVCSYTGHWRGGTPVCQDYERPRFHNCPVNRITYTAKLSDYGVAVWTDPDVRDNSGEPIIVIRTGPSAGTALAVGTHRVTYNARDSAGNMAYPCSFTVNVRRLACPVIYATPYQRVSCPAGHSYGASCYFNCTSEKTLTGAQAVSCDSYGYPPVTYWTWDSAQPTCAGMQCARLEPPVKGALACDYWLYGQFCQMFCQKGWDIAFWLKGQVPELLVCNSNGDWSWKENKLPPCQKARRPGFALKTSAQYFSGECCANDTQRRIREVFVTALSSSAYSSVCYPQECRIDNVGVRCNPPCGDTARRKRSEPVAIVEVSLTLAVKESMSAKENYAIAMTTMTQLAEVLEYGSTNVSHDLDLQFKAVDKHKPTMVCGDGLLPSATTLSCVPCGPGHYAIQALSKCQPCPRGSYREDDEATNCSTCPPETSTRTVGTERRDECLPKCSPGSYSAAGGVQPCTPCELGTFADEEATVKCHPCPSGTTTTDAGASRLADCKAFDIGFVPTAYQQYVSKTTALTSEIQELTLSLKLRLADGQNGSGSAEVVRLGHVFNDTSDTETILRVTIATSNESEVIVEAYGCNVSSSVTTTTQWHSIGVSVNETTLLLHHNGHLVVTNGTCRGSQSYEHGDNITALRATIGNNTDDAFFGEVTDVNVWDKTLTGSEIESATATCGHAAQGNVVRWRDMSVADLIGTSTQIPSQCDVTDDCAPAPCGNHTCVDKLGGYDCRCDDGFTGRHCQVNIDDCANNACENNATCVDGVASYTCLCPESFYGNFCEHEIINGGWGEWGDWSQCSRSCGGGKTTHHRLCDSPPPDADGRQCDGDSEEWQECHTEDCLVCGELQPPDHGSANCSDGEEAINCTAVCDDGYEFSIEPLDNYYCGPDTANRWSHQTEDNPHAQVPDCAEMSLPDKLTILHTVHYADAPCDAPDVVAEAKTRSLETVTRIPCIKNGTCVMLELSVTCNNTEHSRRRRRETTPLLTVSLLLSVSGDVVDNGNSDAVNSTDEDVMSDILDGASDLETAAKVLEARADDGNLTVFVDGVEYVVAEQNIAGLVSCAPGMTHVSILCVACTRGTYSSEEVCFKCPYGLYQDEPQQTSCKSCPDGFTTPGTGSKSRQECNVGCRSGEYSKDHLCEQCPIGFYQDLPAQAACKGCPDGVTTLDIGMALASECNVTCTAGTRSTNHVCEKCPVGFYQDLPAQAACKGCPDGFTTLDRGMAHATECNVSVAAATTSNDDGPLGTGAVLAIVSCLIVSVALAAVAGYIFYHKTHGSVAASSKKGYTPRDRPPSRVAWT